MKKFAKLLVLLLTVALICGAIAMVVSADDTAAKGTDLTAAIANAADGKVTLTGNSFLPAEVTVNKNLTIDLAGYTLTLDATTAFNIGANVEFNIEGNGGKIELAGCLMTSPAGITPNVVVSNVQINHYGTAIANSNYSIIHVYNGTYTFNNVNVTSTAVVPDVYLQGDASKLTYEAFFNMARPVSGEGNVDSSNKAGAKINFYSSLFFCKTSMNEKSDQCGMATFNVVGDGRVTIKDSYAENAGAMFRLAYAKPLTNGQPDGTVRNVYVENSTLKSNPSVNYMRGAFIWAHKLKWEDATTYGEFYFKNSYISNQGYRFSIAGKDNGTSGLSKIVIDGTVLRQGGGNGENDAMISRGIPVYVKNGSAIMDIDVAYAANGAKIYVEKGTRFNMASVVGSGSLVAYNFETNTAGAALNQSNIAYDPAGDDVNPWIYGGTASATFLPEGAERRDLLTFDSVGGTGKQQYGFAQDRNGGLTGYAANFFHAGTKSGANCAVTYGEHTYYKYWVSPDTADANSKIGSKRTFSGSETDPFFNIGDKEVGNTLNNAFAQIGNYKVVVFSYDIATDSEYGYPKTGLGIGARSTAGVGGNHGNDWGVLNPDGTITNVGLIGFPQNGVKLSTTSFNTITLVAFIGEKGVASTGFFYVNGECIGHKEVCTGTATYLQGVRFMPQTGVAHTVGQSFILDSVSRTRYKNYLDATDTATQEVADKYAPAYVPNTETLEVFDFVVGGKGYVNAADAAKAAMENVDGEDKQVRDIKLINPNAKPVFVNANVTIITYGNVLEVADGSYPAKINGDKNAPSSYTFDEAYNDLVIYYYWLRPGYTPQDDVFGEEGTWEEEPEKYFYIQELKAGMTPAPAEGMIHYGSYDPETGIVKVHNGKWALPGEEETGSVFEPLTLEYVMETYEQDAPVMIAPYYDEVTALYYVSDADCHIIRAGETDAEFTAEFRTVTSGENKTITLLDDAAFTEKNAELSGGNNASVTNLDLNGNMLEYRFGGTMAWVGKNMTLNIYSTAPGAEIYHAGWDGSRLISQRMLAISYGANKESNDEIETVYNAHIHLGTIAGIEDSKGEYLSVYTSIIAEGVTGNDTCSIVIDGVHAERYHSESSGMIITRYYNGDIIIKNSTFINYAGNMIDMRGCLNDESVSKDKTGYNNPEIVLTPYVLFDNCTLINLDKKANLLGNNGDGYDGEFKDSEGKPLDVAHQLEFRNCVISCPEGKQINGSNQHERTVFTGKNIFSQTGVSDSVNLIDGQNVYNYYAPVTLESLGLEDLGGYAVITRLERKSDTGELYNYSQAIVEYGAAIPEGFTEGNVYRLPRYFKTAFAHSADEISVTYKDAEGNDIGTKRFYAGPTEAIGNGIPAAAFAGANATVTAPAVADVNLVATKKVFAGWDKDVTNIKENTVVNAIYNVVANVENVKANISLYSDFDVNLYIPEIYKDLVVVKYNGVELEELTTNREGYFKVTVDQLASEAASNVQFEVTVTEAGEIFTLNYSVNVANYAKYILEATEGYTEADKTLMEYVVAYANEAYKYANGGNANETLAKLASDYDSTPIEKNYTAITNPAEISAVVKETNVILQSAPKFQFTIDKEFVGTVVIGGTEYTYTEASAEDRVVTVEGTRAYNFLDDITIKVGTAEGKYNYSAYAAYHVDNAENGTDEESKAASANALALINALYDYVNYAKTYNANK